MAIPPPSRFPPGLLLDDQQFESSRKHRTAPPGRRRPELRRHNIYSVIRGIESHVPRPRRRRHRLRHMILINRILVNHRQCTVGIGCESAGGCRGRMHDALAGRATQAVRGTESPIVSAVAVQDAS